MKSLHRFGLGLAALVVATAISYIPNKWNQLGSPYEFKLVGYKKRQESLDFIQEGRIAWSDVATICTITGPKLVRDSWPGNQRIYKLHDFFEDGVLIPGGEPSDKNGLDKDGVIDALGIAKPDPVIQPYKPIISTGWRYHSKAMDDYSSMEIQRLTELYHTICGRAVERHQKSKVPLTFHAPFI